MTTPQIRQSVTDTVFDTPLVRLNRVIPETHATVLLKGEPFNPMSSVKDRIAEAMISDAEARGLLRDLADADIRAKVIRRHSHGIALFQSASREMGPVLTPKSKPISTMNENNDAFGVTIWPKKIKRLPFCIPVRQPKRRAALSV